MKKAKVLAFAWRRSEEETTNRRVARSVQSSAKRNNLHEAFIN
jgi:hypothetical protein